MKGIILAGGSGTRLYPVTLAVSKQLLPVYDKPMIYYPLTTLMLAGIRDILVITTPADRSRFEALLGDGSQWGIALSYAEQPRPEGLAQAFLIGREFIGDGAGRAGPGRQSLLRLRPARAAAGRRRSRAGAPPCSPIRCATRRPMAWSSSTPDGTAMSIEEKPARSRARPGLSPGLYFYDNSVVDLARELKPSARGELEITDLNNLYLRHGMLRVARLGRGYAWFDTGTHDHLLEAAEYVRTIEMRQGLKIACVEEVAYHHGLYRPRSPEGRPPLGNSEYGRYLATLPE